MGDEKPRNPGGPWAAKAGFGILTEKGLGALLSIILVCALLWGGYTLLSDMRAFQSQMIAEATRTNEKLEQLAINHVEMKLAMDRIERLMLARSGNTP